MAILIKRVISVLGVAALLAVIGSVVYWDYSYRIRIEAASSRTLNADRVFSAQ
jgi:arginine/ornithine N-succinyltransferase beta subunit